MGKKIISLLMVSILAICIFAGCGAKKGGESSNKGSEKKKEITLWYYWENEEHQKILSDQLEKFNSSQEGVVAKAEYIPFADFKKRLSIGVTAGKLPDIVIIDGPDHASYAAMGIFADISGKIDENIYYDGPLNSCKLDGKLYGVPFGSNCLGLYYNEDMLKAEGLEVPTNWTELKKAAKALTKNNISGLAFSSLQNEEGTFNFMPWVWSTGTNSFEINNEKGIRALTYVRDLVKEGAMTQEVINWTQGDVMNQFISGNVAMMVNGPWQVSTMRKQAPDLNWNVALIPKDEMFASVLGGENFGIIKGENSDASLELVKFITSKEQTETYIDKFGYIGARKDVAEGQFSDDMQMKQFTKQLQYAQPRGPHANWPEISDAISLAFNEAITNTSTPEEAAKKAQEKIDSIINK